jgi:hypothetical protein
MTEKGSDELLREAGATGVDALPDAEAQRNAHEEARLVAPAPAGSEPGRSYATPDETPEGEHQTYDTNPQGGS